MKRRCSNDWKDRPKGGTDCMGIGNTCSISMFASPSACMWWPPKKSGNRRWNKQTVMAANNSLLSDAQLLSEAVFGANLDSFSGIPQKALKLIIIKSCCPPELCSRSLENTAKFIFNQKINILNILQSTAKLRGKEFLLNNVKWHLLEVSTWFQLRQSLSGNSG